MSAWDFDIILSYPFPSSYHCILCIFYSCHLTQFHTHSFSFHLLFSSSVPLLLYTLYLTPLTLSLSYPFANLLFHALTLSLPFFVLCLFLSFFTLHSVTPFLLTFILWVVLFSCSLYLSCFLIIPALLSILSPPLLSLLYLFSYQLPYSFFPISYSPIFVFCMFSPLLVVTLSLNHLC